MRQGILQSSRYSPGNMDRESLEAVFVGRDDVMDDVLSRVMASIRGPEKHYMLLVGPRGSGKTHLLALAYHRLMASFDADEVDGGIAIAFLKEEEWGVASYLDLIVRILRALAVEAPQLDAEIANVYESFSQDPVAAEEFAVRLLRRHSEGKTLLVLCENLVDLFLGLGDEGQKRWRSAIQQDGNWAIVATTPQLFAALTLQENPFYGFFTIRPLEEIDLETGIDLLAKKAIHEAKSDLADFLRTPLGRARARAVHHLAAGNHRAYVVLFDFLDKESLEDLIGPFMHMVDDLTPYYQDRMRQLPPTQRKIIEFLCLSGVPATVKEISTSCLMSQQTAAKQIGELVMAGFVSRNRSGRNAFCELSEPLMRICIEVKDNKTRHFRCSWNSYATGSHRENSSGGMRRISTMRPLRRWIAFTWKRHSDAPLRMAKSPSLTRSMPKPNTAGMPAITGASPRFSRLWHEKTAKQWTIAFGWTPLYGPATVRLRSRSDEKPRKNTPRTDGF